MMAHQAGVKTIVVGGRPITGPMQAVSGTRGARVYSADALDYDFDFVNSTIGNATATSLLPSRRDSGMWTTYAGFNIRDQIREGDSTPVQFKYEAADCRIYYTLSNVYNMTQLWRDAAAAAWKDSSLCVEGSTGYPTARNTTSDKNPPERTSQAPGLGLNPAIKVDFDINETPSLMDEIRPTRLGTGEYLKWPSKTDSAPVRGDGYEPGSSKFRPRANAETSHSACRQEVVVVVGVVGGSENFFIWDGEISKTTILVPLHNTATTYPSTKYLCDPTWIYSSR
jgi:hypothetical protein